MKLFRTVGIIVRDTWRHSKERLRQLILFRPSLSDLSFAGILKSELNSKFAFRSETATYLDALVFVGSWRRGLYLRKPFPGFNPDVYRNKLALSPKIDPTFHYLKSNRPKGPWNTKTIFYKQRLETPSNFPSTAIHVHVFYFDLLEEILSRLKYNQASPALYLTHPPQISRESIENLLKSKGLSGNVITLEENRGRDIGPFFSSMPSEFFRNFEVVGHLHTKKSLDVHDKEIGQSWHEFGLANVLGDGKTANMLDQILREFSRNQNLGLVFPDDPNLMGWGKNYEFARELLPNQALPEEDELFNFPVGSYFFVRPAALNALLELRFTANDWPQEPVPYDGSRLHALERLIGIIPGLEGFTSSVTYLDGTTR